jgi:hypothetical protein
MPFVDRDLAGDDRRSAPVAFFEDLEEVVTTGSIEGLKDEQLHAAERPLDAGMAAIAADEREVGEQLRNPLVENGAIVATGFVAER